VHGCTLDHPSHARSVEHSSQSGFWGVPDWPPGSLLICCIVGNFNQMEIFIDEAGTFALNGAQPSSWCTVAAYISPETEKKKYTAALKRLKLTYKKSINDEIKLKEIDESDYFGFLTELSKFKGVFLCVATDSYLNKADEVKAHQKVLAAKVFANVDKMLHENGKAAVLNVASQLEKVPPQLYIQLRCQIQLMHSFIERGIPYFIQRQPSSFKTFRWRVDQKDPVNKTNYEDVFEKFSPTLLQALSIEKPAPMLNWCDYRPMKNFLFKKGDLPEYLVKTNPDLVEAEGLNIGKIIRDDIQFVESKSFGGIQIADLFASGVRRCLRSEFNDNDTAATLLGSLMICNINRTSPINLISIADNSALDSQTSMLIKKMIESCKPMRKIN